MHENAASGAIAVLAPLLFIFVHSKILLATNILAFADSFYFLVIYSGTLVKGPA